ncbi:uncharacterized protein [Mytilus edulis]|uniref:uncharacterized protein n=1 Tax=Mytilus edulis TaxID=6550 RepID=UPI0039F0C161
MSIKCMNDKSHETHFLFSGFCDFLLTLDNKQLIFTPYVIKLLHHVMKKKSFDYLKIILLSSDRLRQANHYTECIKFIKSNFQFISSFPTEKLKIEEKCYYRQQYCITLFLLLNEYVTCYDTHKINLMLTKLLDFRESFLSDIQSTSCYCFIGNKQCMAVGNNSQYLPLMRLESQKRSRGMLDFKQHLLDIWDRTLRIIRTRSSQFREVLLPIYPKERIPRDYDLMMNMDPRERIPRDYDLMMNMDPRERIPRDYDLMMNIDPRERIPPDYDLMMNMDPRERIPRDYDLMMNMDPRERIPHDYDLMMNMDPRERIPRDYDLMMNMDYDLMMNMDPRERIPHDYDLMMNMDPRERIPRDYDLMMNMDPRERIPRDYDLMMNMDPRERIPRDYDLMMNMDPRERIPHDYDLMMNMDPRERIPPDYDLMMNMDPRERIPRDYDLMMNMDPRERIPRDYDLMINMDPREQIPHDYDLMMNNVIQGEMEQASYLKSIIEMMEINKYKVESVFSFIEFIERSTDYNVESLYNIIKMLCAFELKPEIEDMILQGLTAYFMISCNKQYGFLSKLILDMNMICPKSQFLHKLTSCIANSLLKFDDDTVKDFNNIIYKSYCTVRHDCRDKKDKNITKYKDHFNFIASLEAEEEMKKLTSLTNLLLLLTILFMASGGHHKSAELKKYLSLKYEYRDSILYLLWCSGDVEINPGPTLHTLRKVPDSVKERNWIYEMCSMLLRLLKYKSINIRIDGLWKEKPLDWPVDSHFYDPRNKPKGKGYSIKTDRKLLENLEELCNGKGVLEEVTQFDDEYTKSTVKQYQTEITAWRTNKADLFELYILRQELNILLEAKTNLQKYKKEPEIKEVLSVLNVDLIFDSEEDMCVRNAGYTDIVRDIAITLCRIGKGFDPLEKSDGIWKKPPTGWCPTDEYFSPCNAGKRLGKCKDPCKRQGNCKDRKLVDHLLRCCQTMVQEYCKVNEKPVLIKLLHAWKHKNVQEVRKYHTIWSNIEVIDNSLKYLKLEGLLAKSQAHIEKLGIKPRATDSKESIQNSNDLSSRPIQGKQTNPKCPTIIQSHQENHFDTTSKLRDSDASQKVIPLPLMGSKYQETDQTTQNNTNKRKHQSTDENYTEPKKLHKSDKGKPLPVDSSSCKQADNVNKKGETTLDQCVNQIVNLLEEIEQDYSPTVVEPSSGHSSSHSSRDREKDNADKNIQTNLYLDDKLKDLLYELDQDYSPAIVEVQSGNSSSHTGRDGEKDNADKNIQTTSDPDYSEKEMIAPLVELNPDDVTAILEALSRHSSSHRSRDGEKDNADINIQTTSDPDYSEKEMIDLSEELDQATLETQFDDDRDVLKRIGGYQIREEDLISLEGTNWLTDQIINATFQNMCTSQLSCKIYFKDTFFLETIKRKGIESVKKIEDISSLDYVFFPCHTPCHWSLVVFDVRRTCVSLLDPLKKPISVTHSNILQNICKYLKAHGLKDLRNKGLEKALLCFSILVTFTSYASMR